MRTEVASQGQRDLHEKAEPENTGPKYQNKCKLQTRVPLGKKERTGKQLKLNPRSKG